MSLWLFLSLFGLQIFASSAYPHSRFSKDDSLRDSQLGSDKILCNVCLHVMGKIYEFVTNNRTERILKDLAEEICKDLHLHSEEVCHGGVEEYGDMVLYVVDTMLFEPSRVCSKIFEGCGGPPPFRPGTFWRVPMLNTTKPPREKPVLPSPDKPTLRLLHLADMHFDKYYVEGSEADCNDPYCCRKMTQQIKRPAGKWGDTGPCDLPLGTVENMLQHLASRNDFDYVIWTGDAAPHDIWEQTKESQLEVLSILFSMFEKYFPNKILISSAGNHESAPADSYPPHAFDIPDQFRTDWLYQEFSDHWTQFGIGQDPEIRNSIKNTASFITKPFPGLRVISLNTIYCLPGNYWLYLNQYDPDNLLSWLIRQLQDAEDVGDKVHIIGHIPPGNTCLKEWSANFYDIINRYEKTITGLFYGHTHADSFVMFYENGTVTDPTHVAYVAPSATTYSDRWPAFRIYTIDGNYEGSSFRVLDHETYVLNIEEANSHNNLTWALEYKAKEGYGLDSLLPESWNQLINRFIEDDDLFQRYYSHLDRAPRPPCHDKCKSQILCDIRKGRSHDPDLCKDL